MAFQILGVGTANPANELTQEAASEIMQRVCCEDEKQHRLANVLIRRSGVETRHTCVPYTLAYEWEDQPDGPTLTERMEVYEAHASPLAVESAREALFNADIDPRKVTHIVTVSCTGFESPGVDFSLISELGMSPGTQRVNVGYMGCHGAINGLRVAQGLAAQDSSNVVLLVATELCSLHYAYGWKPEQLVGNAIFADGSAAVVGAGKNSEEAPTESCQWSLVATGSQILPDSAELMTWRIRNHGFEMTLSAELPAVIESQLADWLSTWLADYGLSIDEVGSWAIHPGGPKIVSSVEKALDLGCDATSASKEVLREHGNMSSPTVLFVIDRLRNSNAKGPCVAIGFGPGIVAEVALFK